MSLTGDGLPLDGQTTVRVLVQAKHFSSSSMRELIRSLPSVTAVHDDPSGSSDRFAVDTLSLATFLTALGLTLTTWEWRIRWHTGGDLVIGPADPVQWHASVRALNTDPRVENGRDIGPTSLPANSVVSPGLRRRSALVAAAILLIGAFLVGTVLAATCFGRFNRDRSRSVGRLDEPMHSPTRVASLRRALDSPCAVSAHRTCDAAEAARWRGDLDAWRVYATGRGLRAPTPEEAEEATITMRLDAGDPDPRIRLSQAMGAAAVLITAVSVTHDETSASIDVEVELANLGVAPAELSNATITTRDATLFRLPPSASLAAGERCRLSTRAASATFCGFAAALVRRPGSADVLPIMLQESSGAVVDALSAANTAP